MLPSNVMSFVKKMVTTEEVAGGHVEPPGTFGKLRQTLSSSLLTAQDKVTKLSPRPGAGAAAAATPPEPESTPAPPQPVQPPQPKQEREAGKPPSRAGACRVCLKALKPGDVYHTCRDCQHRVCEDCSSYSKPTNDEDASFWRCSVCRRKAAPRRPPAAQDSTDSLLDVPMLDALQRRHSEARLGGGGGGGGALAPPRSPELRRHSDVSPASLKELEKLKGGGKGDGETSRRASGGGGAGVTATVGGGVSPARRRSVRVPRQRSCDEDKPDGKDGGAGGAGAGLGNPAPMPRRASAYDVFASGGAGAGVAAGGAGAGGGSRRPSYRGDAEQPSSDSAPQISGLSVDEDRPLRRRGSQLPDIAALQRGGLSALGTRGSADSADGGGVGGSVSAAAMAAAARQLSVDGEAIKIVIHDVDDTAPRRVILTRDPADKGHRTRGFGMRVVGGKPDASGRREAVVVWTVPGGPADLAGLQQGDKVLEWGGVPLTERSFEEVCSVLERGGDTVEVLVQASPLSDLGSDHHAQHTAHAPPPQLLFEPESDKSPSSPTRRKLPKTPEQGAAGGGGARERERERERVSARAQLQVWFESELRKLVVTLLAADDLPPRDHTLGYGDEPEAFARIRLLPSLESCPPVETDPASASCSPVWNATLGFGGLTADLLAGRALELTLWDACPGIDPVLIGECTLELEKAFAEERAVWWTLEERGGTRSAGASPRGSLTGARALRRGDFANQRSVSDDVDSIGECASLLHPDHAWVGGSRRGSSQSETLEVEVYQLNKDFSRSLPGSRRSSFQQAEKDGAATEPPPRRNERRRSSCVRRDPDDILRSLRAVKGELGRTLSLTGSTARRTATGRKGSMWAAVPAAARDPPPAGAGAPGDDDDEEDGGGVPLGPGQLPPRTHRLPPLHAEINLSIIMVKGQLELEVSHARRAYGVDGEVPDSYVKCYLRDGDKWLHKRKTRIVRRTTEPHFNQTLKYQASEALGRTLVVMLWQRCGGFEHNLALGGAEIALHHLTLPQRTYGWYPLFPATALAARDDSPD